jgi:hypothetical protein
MSLAVPRKDHLPDLDPVVYLGPSLNHQRAAALLPAATFRPPIRRDDLYRDREAGHSLFVIIDGVFFNSEAVSPREVVDVLADGAVVVGAASMGALRAAECWPSGMRGIGSIYRLFRAGSLTSDEEVAVAFSLGPDHDAVSVALVNVRHALRTAVRNHQVDAETAARIVTVAEQTFYADRTWRRMLRTAGIDDRDRVLESVLGVQDLKRDDAVCALRRVGRWLEREHGLAHSERAPRQSVRSASVRERSPLPPIERQVDTIKHDLARWHLLSGRYLRHAPAIAATHSARFSSSPAALDSVPQIWQGRTGGTAAPSASSLPAATAEAWTRSSGFRRALLDMWAGFTRAESEFAELLWAELSVAGELDAELFRWAAIRDGVAEAGRRGLRPVSCDKYVAERQTAHAHGFVTWRHLQDAARATAYPWDMFCEYRDRTALCKRLRRHLFS